MDRHSSHNHWISISDMMAGIMMIFLLIMISFMLLSQKDQEMLSQQNKTLSEMNDKMRSIAQHYSNLQAELYIDLQKELVLQTFTYFLTH